MKLPAVISVVLHAALFAIFVAGARFHPARLGGFGPGDLDITPVSMVGPEALPGPPAAARAAPPPPKPEAPEPAKVIPPEKPKPDKTDEGVKLPSKAKPKPAKTARDTVAVAPKPAPAPATAAERAAAALADVPDAPARHGGLVAAGIEGEVGGGGGGGGGGGFGDFAYYRVAMQNKIATHWSPGFVSGEAVAIVYFRIIRSGRVVGARVEQSSGIPFYDQTALRAVVESSPLPPLPAQFPDDTVGVHFRFRYKP